MSIISTATIVTVSRVLKAHNCNTLSNIFMTIVLRNPVTVSYFVSLYFTNVKPFETSMENHCG
jgi:hypothetical protein